MKRDNFCFDVKEFNGESYVKLSDVTKLKRLIDLYLKELHQQDKIRDTGLKHHDN